MKAERLAVAKVGKTHSLSGELRLYTLSGEEKHLFQIKRCFISLSGEADREIEVDRVSKDGKSLFIHFKGYDTPEKAKTLSGSVIKLKREECTPLKEGEYYIADLYDMDVLYQGEKVAVVDSTLEGGQALLLEVVTKEGRKYLVPLMNEYVGRVDVDKNTLELKNIELLQ